MAQKTKGMRNKTRKKLSKGIREKDTITKHLKEFDEGEQVLLDIDPAVHAGIPAPQFHGKTGTVTGKRGRAFLVEITDGGKDKELAVYPAHLKEV